MEIEILEKPFDPWRRVRAHQERLRRGSFGAQSLFVGTMRDCNEGAAVEAMWLEHYPGMTARFLRRAVRQACRLHAVEDVFIAHRVGWVYPGDAIVAVAVWAAHRREACAVNRVLVEELKARAPFWKKEKLAAGAPGDGPGEERWVEHNTPSASEPAVMEAV